MKNYEIRRTLNGKTEVLSTIIPANNAQEAIFKAFDLARIVTGSNLPADGDWVAVEMHVKWPHF